MVGTAYLRDEPDLHQLAKAINLMAGQILAENRKHRDDDTEPQARVA